MTVIIAKKRANVAQNPAVPGTPTTADPQAETPCSDFLRIMDTAHPVLLVEKSGESSRRSG